MCSAAPSAVGTTVPDSYTDWSPLNHDGGSAVHTCSSVWDGTCMLVFPLCTGHQTVIPSTPQKKLFDTQQMW